MSDDTRVLLYSLTHGGYVGRWFDEGYCTGDSARSEPFRLDAARTEIESRPDWRLVIADLDGWIQHDGGECPVAPDFKVDIRVRLGAEKRGCAAKTQVWGWHSGGTGSFDITAWRPAQEERDGREEGRGSVCMGGSSVRGGDSGEPVAGPVTPDTLVLREEEVEVPGAKAYREKLRKCLDMFEYYLPAHMRRDVNIPAARVERFAPFLRGLLDALPDEAIRIVMLDTQTASPVTPDAAGVGGVRERLVAACGRSTADYDGSELERLELLCLDLRDDTTLALAALPEGELIDAGEWNLDPRHGFMTIPEPGRMIATGTFSLVRDGICEPGTYRVFVQRKGVG